MALKLNSSSGGSVTLQEPTTASNYTLTVPAQTATLDIAGPAFSAYQSSQQTLSTNTTTKIQFQTEEWDTANCFDNTTNYRFTPNVAGYYQVNAGLQVGASNTNILLKLYKNGSLFKSLQYITQGIGGTTGSAIVYLNGSTDYIEIYGEVSAGQGLNNSAPYTYFQASLVRAA